MIELTHLYTGYSTRSKVSEISKDINATLEKGELVSLLGPNGAGKSTLLKTLCGFLPPLKGEIRIEGKGIEYYKREELARIIAVVLTERPAVISMTVEEMVAIGRSPYTGIRGRLTPGDREIVRQSMDFMGITGMRERRVDTLSDGERQKVMIAKALAQETPIILLDEPSAFLDFPSKVELMISLRKLAHEQKKIIMLSTHDLNVALELSDRLFLIDKNIGAEFGSTEELASNGSLEKFFRSEYIRLENLQFVINS